MTPTASPEEVCPADQALPLPTEPELFRWLEKGTGQYDQGAARVLVDAAPVTELRRPSPPDLQPH